MLEKSVLLGQHRPDLTTEETIASIFRQSAQQYADKTALIFGDKALTYTQLNSWTDAIAHFLQTKGIGRGHSVGVWHTRGLALHAAILGIVKSGAAYVPLDREMPEERLQIVLEEVGATACISDGTPNLGCPVYRVPDRQDAYPHFSLPEGPQPDDQAYVLYTSGSTGKPKGIPISHRNISHLIRSEQAVIQIRSEDKVYQGFSVSFDMWCEETWISFSAGATLWVADAATSKSIDELSDVLRREHITILHAVPSLLAVMDDNIPNLRLINAGGEACTPQVLNRWSKPGKNVFYNSYGPTETTVTSTMIALKPGDLITIGDPLPNYNLAVVDEQYNLLPAGQRGELVISGPGLSTGYVNKPELTREKFLPMPPELAKELPGDRIYRTGDAVVIKENGTVDFQGRIDDQIKLRGYRIELGEIESRLNEMTGVSAAAVAVKKDNNELDQLVGYVVHSSDAVFDEQAMRTELARTLPPYMVPVAIALLDKMPRLPSGKIDRKSLPVPEVLLQAAKQEEVVINPDDPLRTRLLATLHAVFPGREITPEMDFFTDLGGHSLLAATFASRLRQDAGITQVSLKDIYTNRPVSSLVSFLEEKEKKQTSQTHESPKVFHKISSFRYWVCGLAQLISLLFLYGLFAVQIFVPYLGYYYVVARTESGRGDVHVAIITALALFLLIPPFFSFFSIISKRLIIGKYKEGDYPLWGLYYFRYWLVKTIQRLVPAQFMNGTPMYPFYLRLLGMKVAPDAQLSSMSVGAEDLVSIGKDVSISSQVVLDNASVEDGLLKLRRIRIGDHAYIGTSAVISGGATIEEWGELQDLSHLQEEQTIRAREVWNGSPAQCIGQKLPEELPQPLPVSGLKRKRFGFLYSILLIIFPVVVLLPMLPIIRILNYLDLNSPDYDFSYLIYVPFLTMLYVLMFMFETALLARLLQWNIRPGQYPVYSWFYIRKWLSDQLISMALIVLHPIYATVYVSFFFRLLGAKVGKNTEISTASNVTHPLLEIGKESFIADAVTLGEADVRGQQLILKRTTVGNRSFVGNSALIPQGYDLAGGMLIGVLSLPPTAEQMQKEDAKDWFGSPAIALPRRQDSGDYPESLTTSPSMGRRLARGIVEGIRIILPETVIICCSVLFIAYGHDLVKDRNLWQILREMPKLPFYYLFFMGIPAFGASVLLKWLAVGVNKKEQKPMWTHKVWRSEAVTTTYEALAVPFFLDFLRGTPFLPMALRCFGVKVGKRVWLNTTDITEHDLVSIGDDAALNEECGPQTHLFEDRVMKTGTVRIGARCSIGARSIILYDSRIGNDVKLAPLSLVMKGENLTDGTSWIGSPVRPL